MSTTVELPGGHAVIRDPRTVTERQRRPVSRLQTRLAASPIGRLLQDHARIDEPTSEQIEALGMAIAQTGDTELLDELNDALIGCLVESWSWDFDVSADAALDLPSDAYDALRTAVAPYVHELMPSEHEPSPDPESPTPPSVA